MTPDFDRAALKAIETLIKYNIKSAPISALSIIKAQNNVLVLSFTELSSAIGVERDKLVNICGENNQDAVTTIHKNGETRYLVAYNQKLPSSMFQRALARELGHIILGHDGSRPEETRTKEALCFACHLLCPRPLVHAIQERGVPFTTEVLVNVTGIDKRFLSRIQNIPAVDIPPELNRKVKEQFNGYINNYLSYQSVLSTDDPSPVVDFGTFMEGYKE